MHTYFYMFNNIRFHIYSNVLFVQMDIHKRLKIEIM